MDDNHMKGCSDATGVRERKIRVTMQCYCLSIRQTSAEKEIINAVGMNRSSHQLLMEIRIAVFGEGNLEASIKN